MDFQLSLGPLSVDGLAVLRSDFCMDAQSVLITGGHGGALDAAHGDVPIPLKFGGTLVCILIGGGAADAQVVL